MTLGQDRQGSHGSRCARPADPAGHFPGRSGQAGFGAPPGEDVDGEEARLYGDKRTNCTTISVHLQRQPQLGGFAWARLPSQRGPAAAFCHAAAGYVWQEAFFIPATGLVTPAGRDGMKKVSEEDRPVFTGRTRVVFLAIPGR